MNTDNGACVDCLGRTPYASLMATITMCLGVGLFCGTGFRALDLTLNGIFVRLLHFSVPWLHSIQVGFMIFGIVMGLFAIMLLLFGFLSTGLTRQNIYSSLKCIVGGQLFGTFLMILTYVLNMMAMAVACFCAMPIIVYVMLRSICQHEIERRDYWYLDDYCLNLTRFGVYRNASADGFEAYSLCDVIDLSQFCEYVYDAGPMYCFAYAGALLIMLGLVTYLVTLSLNYQRIKSSKELTEYRSLIDLTSPNN